MDWNGLSSKITDKNPGVIKCYIIIKIKILIIMFLTRYVYW